MDSSVTVQEVMDREFLGVSESDTVAETAELMLTEEVESVVVVRGDRPVGIMTERDALGTLVDDAAEAPVTDAMETDVPTVSPELTIGEAADEMSAQGRKRLVVTDGDAPVGVVSEHDLITTSPFAPDTRVGDEPEAALVGHPDDRASATDSAGRGFEDQSICEACGAFARDLATFNGQLLCSDCRDI